jgi:spermidine synthase
VIPREVIAVAEVPGGPPLRLVRHGGDHIIMLERNELMSTRKSGSEKALATMTCERLGRRKATRLLIGGYGMGFTLRAALAELGGDARVTVAELVPDILDWARGPMEALTDGCLDDPRVDIRVQDVATAMEPGAYDAILLDVDNGPDGLTRPANDGLYSMSGLARARRALKPGGILAVWSAGPDAAFARRLGDAGFLVDEVKLRARENGKGPIHIIWFAAVR